MISHVTGQLVELREDSVVIERDGVGYTVATPRYALGELASSHGRQVTLHTILFVEGGQNGAYMEPLLIGFPNPADKLFFRRFISVKGIGARKALKALSLPMARVAAWIEAGDVKALKELPGIGARAAELIVAELKGKLKDMAIASSDRGEAVTSSLTPAQRDALEIMVSLGDSRIEAEQWLERAARLDGDIVRPDEWLRAAYKIKTGTMG